MRRALWIAGGVLVVGVVAAALMLGPGAVQMSRVGSGYVAKQVCSCMYVAGRDFDACRADMPADMDPIEAEAVPGQPAVRAGVLGITRTARHTPGFGCALLD